MSTIMSILLQNTAAAEGNGWGNIIFIVALVAIFYFFMIRPQSKRQKEIKKFRDSLKQGDKVITAGGIHGKIKNVKENTVTLEIADGMNITVEKTSIYATAPEESEQPQK
ncbi:MAG: preprotein translocase subunit YajC [Muribaculaceae bacterium]|nr:preprotein translocase subunit YajC [Muribaculaceae bacterium]